MQATGLSRPDTWTHHSGPGLDLEVTTAHDTKTFREFFAEYDKAFILPSEKEEESGFAACLALNRGAEHERLVAEFGEFVELCLVVRDRAGGSTIGGANLIAMQFTGPEGKAVVTSNLNYVFTTAASRGKGYFRPLLAALGELIETLFPGPRPLIFVEQNDPFRMTPEAYAEDTAHAGIDQFDRLLAWAKVGARVLDFDYVQPGLSADQPADDTLVYTILNPAPGPMPPAILVAHLLRFFTISVAKGRPVADVPEVEAQLSAIDGNPVRVLDPKPVLAEVTAGDGDRWSRWEERPTSLARAVAP